MTIYEWIALAGAGRPCPYRRPLLKCRSTDRETTGVQRFLDRRENRDANHLGQLGPEMLGQLAARPDHVKDLQHRLARAVVLKAAIFFYDLQIFGQRLLVFARGGQGLGQFKARLQVVGIRL